MKFTCCNQSSHFFFVKSPSKRRKSYVDSCCYNRDTRKAQKFEFWKIYDLNCFPNDAFDL